MNVPVSDIENVYPCDLSEITLGAWIDFTNTCKELDTELITLQKLPDNHRKRILLTSHMVERAYNALAFFTGKDIEEVKQIYFVDDVLQLYNDRLAKLFESGSCKYWPCHGWTLPSPELSPGSYMSFGEFIDSKVIAQAADAMEQSKWELLQYICAIFLRHPDEPYNDAFVDDNNERFLSMRSITMDIAMAVMDFFEDLNKYIEENFTLFHESGEKEGAAIREHFKQWGWVNFLKSIAKTKVFDIPNSGMNSIDCARKAKCYEVLIFASEEKDYNVAINRDMEALYKK